MTLKKLVLTASMAIAPVLLAAQNPIGLDPAAIARPLADSWPTFAGDYRSRRYSAL